MDTKPLTSRSCWDVQVSESVREGFQQHWTEGRAGNPLSGGLVLLSIWGDFEKFTLCERVSKSMRRLVEVLRKFPLYYFFKDWLSKPTTLLVSFWFISSFNKLIFRKDYESVDAIVKGAQVPILQYWLPKYTFDYPLLCFQKFHKIWHPQLLQWTKNP